MRYGFEVLLKGKRRAVKKESVSRDLFIGQLFIVANHNLELDLDFLSKTRTHATDAKLVFQLVKQIRLNFSSIIIGSLFGSFR